MKIYLNIKYLHNNQINNNKEINQIILQVLLINHHYKEIKEVLYNQSRKLNILLKLEMVIIYLILIIKYDI